ncbi:hypothetical protein CEB3_c21170 [Peptococcaceae bacterium CEB3]|nr:hypothetical protein CEB3_c21170 [Peptococcaceae bacterium CEB3]
MYFVDEEHERTFRILVEEHDRTGDREYLAAYYVLTADEELRRKTLRFVRKDGIPWLLIWEQDWSSGYQLLLKLAEHLFMGGEVDLVRGVRTWGDTLYKIAIQAIEVRRKGI